MKGECYALVGRGRIAQIVSRKGTADMEPQRIDKDELKRRLDAGEAFTILDDRSPEAWEKADSQLPGSIRVPPDDLDKHLQEIPLNARILTYCT